MKLNRILLTSIGLSAATAQKQFEQLITDNQYVPVSTPVYIAYNASEIDAKYVQLAHEQFRQMGFRQVHLIDITTELPNEDRGIMYVAGGNTYKLLADAQQSNFLTWFVAANDWLYIGVSAGAIILGKTLFPASFTGDVPITGDFTPTALGISEKDIVVHYVPDMDEKIREHYTDFDRVITVSNESCVTLSEVEYTT